METLSFISAYATRRGSAAKSYNKSRVMDRLLFAHLASLAFSSVLSNDATQSLYCELGLANDDFCAVDGGWTAWNAWGPCKGKCGSKGRRTRSRSCNNPLPSNNGAPCIGAVYQTEACQIPGCTISDYEQIAGERPVTKEEMRIVQAVHEKLPALIELCFSVDCSFSIVKKILGSDATAYWNAMNCVKYNVGCPVYGGWSYWDAWSACTAACGRGQRYRLRRCDSPKPSAPELTCDGLAFEAKDCTGMNCEQHSRGRWGHWSDWSECSSQCGSGVKRKTRLCTERQERRTSCEGPSEKIAACETKNCSMDGEWSPWTVWTTCSSSCGIGTQLRNRMCNNPAPSGRGETCSGAASEVRQCFTKPCFVRSHEVAHFKTESGLFYPPKRTPSRLFHLYLRFLPLTSFGVLVHRFQEDCRGLTCDFVKLSLRNGKIVLLSQISGCTLGLIHEDKLEIGNWQVILVLICGTYSLLRVNNGLHKVAFFSCVPLSQNLDHSMKIGSGFHGQIQEVAINFVPVQLRPQKQRGERVPYSSNNVQYQMAEDDEGYLRLALTESVAAPCPKRRDFWKVTLALKSEDIDGVIAIVPGDSPSKYILLTLEEGRVKLRLRQGTIDATVESREHILVGEWFEVLVIQDGQNLFLQVNGNEKNYIPPVSEKNTLVCTDNIFLGAVRDEIKGKVCPKCAEIPQMSFTLGLLEIDDDQIDLLSLPTLEVSSKRLTSRTISFPDYYEEVPLLLGQELKLSCFYDKIPREERIYPAHLNETFVAWLLMDKPLNCRGRSEDIFTVKDNGRVSTISAASYIGRDQIENFYSCEIRRYKNSSFKVSRALFTFGVTVIDANEGTQLTGKQSVKELEDLPWNEWSFVCGATIVLLIFLSIWCSLEALWDVRNGHGFYRLPGTVKNGDPTSIVNFALSKEGIILLGSRQAADETVTKLTENN